MRLFIISYLVSVSAIILGSLPAIKAAPLDTIPRICFYFGFPAAILISFGVIAAAHLFGMSRKVATPGSMVFEPGKQSEQLDNRKVA